MNDDMTRFCSVAFACLRQAKHEVQLADTRQHDEPPAESASSVAVTATPSLTDLNNLMLSAAA
jgi:hypothetical protein